MEHTGYMMVEVKEDLLREWVKKEVGRLFGIHRKLPYFARLQFPLKLTTVAEFKAEIDEMDERQVVILARDLGLNFITGL